ncbi:MAG: TldD/PmbA family protein [Acidobacteriia bacterium]|nr:TldD/PmbA family protein [Terriglobia bacterium]
MEVGTRPSGDAAVVSSAGTALCDLAQQTVRLAVEAGASAAECTMAEGDEFSVSVRLGAVETLKESGSRGAGIRVLIGRNAGCSYTSDLSGEGLRAMVLQALDLARVTSEDPHAGLPDPSELGKFTGDLSLFHEDVGALETATKIEMAREGERVALAVDPRINNSDGGSFGSHTTHHAFANSLGFSGSYRTSSCSLSVVPVARDGDSMERDYWFTAARSARKLETPGEVGRRAAERVLRRLKPRKVSTQRVPVVFEPRAAKTLVGHIFEAVHGESVYRKASILAGKLGEKVASEKVTIIDDSTMPGLFGSSPFDDEGVPSRRTVVIDKGVLRTYLVNTYTARKLGMKTTGNASRGLSGNLGIGHGNLYLENGTTTLEQLLREAGTGLYVTELMGFGFNAVTGDYSRGATGLWIENGELAYAVSEVTIAANLRDMLMGIEVLADDLEFRGSVAAPTVLIREMTVSGH